MEGHGGGGAAIPGQDVDDELLFMTALRRLVAEDFSQTCAPDRACGTCPAPFCGHCCGEHHRGHDGVVAALLEVGAGEKKRYRRDSFCVGCGAAFCSRLCAHHGGEGHDVMRVDEYGGRHFARCTGAERWFHFFFDGVETYEDKDGNLMIPLQRRRPGAVVPEPGLKFSTRHP
ncbi:hypothetical protein SETIT_3G101200v2 [Setaria italica]|uniref:Uncharacterized protein n=1 Tax=Setaria italica TaxID=4555 RepID=A0A368QDN3_SETIT|nr:hypothetical protein SETIT_3G101200v2 [Setaria italica]